MRSLFPDCLNTAKTFLLAAAASLGGSVLAAFGGADVWLSALACTMGADYLTGLLLALVWKRSPKTENGAASSQAGLKGLFKKGAMFLTVLVAHQLDLAFSLNYLRGAVIMAFLANELLSLAENLGLMGIPWPSVMQNAIELLTAKEESQPHGDRFHRH